MHKRHEPTWLRGVIIIPWKQSKKQLLDEEKKKNERNKQKKVVVELKLKTETDDGMVLLNSVGALKLIINEWIKSYPPLLLLLIAYPIPCPSHTLARYLHWNPS